MLKLRNAETDIPMLEKIKSENNKSVDTSPVCIRYSCETFEFTRLVSQSLLQTVSRIYISSTRPESICCLLCNYEKIILEFLGNAAQSGVIRSKTKSGMNCNFVSAKY